MEEEVVGRGEMGERLGLRCWPAAVDGQVLVGDIVVVVLMLRGDGEKYIWRYI